ncbi:MAG: hypothetical protein ACK5GN_01535 [Pseudomonadota bacterium]
MNRFKNFARNLVCSAAVAMIFVGVGEAEGEVNAAELNGDSETAPTGNEHSVGTTPKQTLSPKTGALPSEPLTTPYVRMRAHKTYDGLVDAAEYKKMFNSMVTQKVPVLFQTMMMVENGAANGFIGSLQAVSNMYSNTMQAADLELQMRGVQGPDAQKQYVNAVYDGLQKNKDVNESAVAGLIYASGDAITDTGRDTTPKNNTIDQPVKLNSFKGAAVASNLPQGKRPDGGDDARSWKLWDTLFKQGGGTGAAAVSTASEPNDDNQYKEWLKKYVGDIEFSHVAAGGGATYTIEAKYVEAKATPLQVGGNTSQDDGFKLPDKVFGVNVLYDEVTKQTWKDMYGVLRKYCEFKTVNKNSNNDLFNKEFVSKTVGEDLIKVSSRNLKVSLNLIDQIFKIWVQTSTDATQPTKIICEFREGDGAVEQMPDNYKVNEAGDSCTKEPKNCRRNKWLLRLVKIIALDKVIERAGEAYEVAMNKALMTGYTEAEKVNLLFCSSLVAAQNSENGRSQCNIGFWFDSMQGYNRQRWSDQLEAAAKLAQSIGGSSNFRFQPNNSLATGAGGSTDSRGDVSPGAGEGNS